MKVKKVDMKRMATIVKMHKLAVYIRQGKAGISEDMLFDKLVSLGEDIEITDEEIEKFDLLVIIEK